jgi:hypothetical protein
MPGMVTLQKNLLCFFSKNWLEYSKKRLFNLFLKVPFVVDRQVVLKHIKRVFRFLKSL